MSRGSAGEKLTHAIMADLFAGRLHPGDRLDEQGLATRYGVSRTPVREALRQLASSGLVELIPNRGATVRRLSAREASELFETVGEIHALCARLATERMTALERRALEELTREGAVAAQNGDAQTYRRNNLEFHGAICRGTHNTSLLDIALSAQLRSEPYRSAQFSVEHSQRLMTSQQEHEAILQALMARDAARAEHLMRDHIATSSMNVIRRLALEDD